MTAIRFITPADAAFGFGITGIGQSVTGPEQADQTVREAMTDAAIGLIALDERLLAALSAETMHFAEKRWPGVFVVLPAPAGTEAGGDYVSQLVARAIGYQVRLG